MFRKLALKQNSTLAEPIDLELLGKVANEQASVNVFADYQSRRSDNTLRRQRSELTNFAEFIGSRGGEVGELAEDALAWRGITWGLVSAFVLYMLKSGYAVGSVNAHLSTIKTYAKLSARSGGIDAQEAALVQTVEGYSRNDGERVNGHRQAAGVPERVSSKKRKANYLTPEQVEQLKSLPDTTTAQGRRDKLMLCLLAEHGLRVGELSALTVSAIDTSSGEMRFYRQKVNKWQTHELSADTLAAAREYISVDLRAHHTPESVLLRGSRRGGKLAFRRMSERAIYQRVAEYGERLGISCLGPHDLRHTLATRLARSGKSLTELLAVFGWSSPAMALRYIEQSKVVKV